MKIDEIHKYNASLKTFLAEIWSYVPKGRQKQLVKDQRIRGLLDRFHIEY